MKKLMLIAVSSLMGATFLLGANMDEAFYMENSSVWITKKTETEQGIKVNIKVDGLVESNKAPILMAGIEGQGWKKPGWGKGGRWGKGHIMRKVNIGESQFVGYLPSDKDATVMFTCTTTEGTVVFKTTLQTLTSGARRPAPLKTVAKGSTYLLWASAVKVPAAIQVGPFLSSTMINVNSYVIDFKGFKKVESGSGKFRTEMRDSTEE